MGPRLAFGVALASVVCLFSAPVYEQVSWKGGVPPSLRERIALMRLDTTVGDSLFGTERYHAVEVGANRMLRIDLISEAFDPFLALYRASRDTIQLLGQDDDSGEGTNSHLEKCIDHEGLYVLRVSAFGSNRREGRYTIRVASESANCAALAEAERQREAEAQRQHELEAERQREQARTLYRGRPITLGQSVTSYLGPSAARLPDGKPFEAWDLACESGTTFQMDIEASGYDAYAIVVDSAGNQVATNDDGGGGFNPRITYTCMASGIYHLVSTSYASSTSGGRYTLRVARR